MDKNKKYLQNVACLLDYNESEKHGKLLPLHTAHIAIFCFITGLLFVLLIISVAIAEGALWALASFIPLLFFLASIMIFNRTKKKKKQLCLWLDDMVECFAQAETKQSHRNWNPFDSYTFGTTDLLIQIKFEYEGKIILIYAMGTKSLFTRYVGQYTNRKIRILYSPNYDTILILKDNSPKLDINAF